MLVRVANDLGNAGQTRQLVGRALRVTAGHDDSRLWVFTMDAPDGGTGVLIGGRGHCAGVEDDNFGLVGRGGAFHAALLELPFNGGAVGLGGAAAKILYVVTCHRTIVAALQGAVAAVSHRWSVASRQPD